MVKKNEKRKKKVEIHFCSKFKSLPFHYLPKPNDGKQIYKKKVF